MKIVCAWCGQILGFRCPFCGEPLKLVKSPSTDQASALVCDSGPSQIHFHSTRDFAVSHGICKECRYRFTHGPDKHDVLTLTAEDLYNLALMDGPEENHENPRKKRGPTGGNKEDNNPQSGTPGKETA